MDFEIGGIFGLIVLILDVWAVVNVFSSSAKIGMKVFWIVLIVVLPVVGFIIWYFAGPRSG